jgi:hypothetical protein
MFSLLFTHFTSLFILSILLSIPTRRQRTRYSVSQVALADQHDWRARNCTKYTAAQPQKIALYSIYLSQATLASRNMGAHTLASRNMGAQSRVHSTVTWIYRPSHGPVTNAAAQTTMATKSYVPATTTTTTPPIRNRPPTLLFTTSTCAAPHLSRVPALIRENHLSTHHISQSSPVPEPSGTWDDRTNALGEPGHLEHEQSAKYIVKNGFCVPRFCSICSRQDFHRKLDS